MTDYMVTRDGFFKFGPATDVDCMAYIHKAQGQSVEWAVKHEGWAIVEASICPDCMGTQVEESKHGRRPCSTCDGTGIEE